ncbi:DinB family protein [Paenisporosarcina macmurdoensis]|uniref:DinB family protein n=1 Tax=Paenisporosarcina macmurdoensis TaxID=212659 RepID=A0ABW1L6L7_9BACL
MKFQIDEAIEILERTPTVLSNLLFGLSNSWTVCDEGEATWNAFDVIGHLIEGEKYNWIPRIEIIISKGETETFPVFDRFSQLHQNTEKTIEQLLNEFTELRMNSLERLGSLINSPIDLGKMGLHPEFGSVKLREQLSTWVAHDLDHISQIARVMAKRYTEDVGPWKAYLRILNQ